MTGVQRALTLAASLALGVIVGAAGSYFTGSDHWWLAVPVAIAIPWFRVADPEHCLRQSRAPGPAADREGTDHPPGTS